MTIIAEKDRETIRDLLARDLDAAVELLFFTQPRSQVPDSGFQVAASCAETHELLDDLVGLAEDRLSLVVHDLTLDPSAAARYNVSELPMVAIRRATAGASDEMPAGEAPANVRYVGLPAGFEFSALLADVVDVSRARTDLADATRRTLRAIDVPIHLQVFVTPT